MRTPHAAVLRQSTRGIHPQRIHHRPQQDSTRCRHIQPPPASTGAHDAANKGLHTGNTQASRRNGGSRGKTHVHADARSREAERHNDYQRLLRSIQPGQDARGVHEPAAQRRKAYLTQQEP